MNCQHTVIETGPDRCFSGSVATRGLTDANPAAHGSISFVEFCLACGHMRDVNANQGHREYSVWYEPAHWAAARRMGDWTRINGLLEIRVYSTTLRGRGLMRSDWLEYRGAGGHGSCTVGDILESAAQWASDDGPVGDTYRAAAEIVEPAMDRVL